MSLDYFGALLRAAGQVPSASSPPTPARAASAMPLSARAPAGEDLVEVEIEHDATPPQAGAWPARADAHAFDAGAPAQPSPWPPSVDRTGASHSPAPLGDAPPAPAAPAAHRPQDQTQALAPPAEAAPPLHAAVRAALAWVAADPLAGAATALPHTPDAPATSRRRAGPDSLSLEGQEEEERPQARDPTGPAAFGRPTLDRHADRLAAAAEAAPPPPDAPHDAAAGPHAAQSASMREMREEVVEVSIGTIHLRVDAPSPGSMAPAAPAPVRAPAPRSPLSRRALYRI